MPTQPQKMNLESLNITEQNREQLRRVFPDVFTEDAIDFDQLRRVLGESVNPGKERFGLNWPGKAECMKIIQQPSVATLKPARDESVDFDDTENLFIEGDNLEVLKLLQKAYFGKVKMIYIDPPYNTGKEFIYPDKYSETLDTYLEYTEQKDSKGRKFSTNTDTQGRYHSNWLNMMYPRLYLAKNLLREDGVIFISIDDNEQANLKKLCDEVFGEENFVTQIAWQGMDTVKNDAKYFSDNHEYILCYAKNKDFIVVKGMKRTDKHKKVYKNYDNDPRGPYLLTSLQAKSGSNNSIYKHIFENNREWTSPPGTFPRFSRKKLKELEKDNRIYFGKNKDATPQKKTFLSEVSGFIKLGNFWGYKFAGSTRRSNIELSNLMGRGLFPNPKPTSLLKIMLESVGDKNDIILDFFAGSCTTAHAVMQLNAEDGGQRRYICVQLPEPCNEQSEAYQAGYKNIADIGKERIRRVAKSIAEQHSQTDLHDHGPLDLGFKAFKLTRSNLKVWEGDAEKIKDLAQQLFDHADHIDTASTPEDLLYELLLKSGYPLTTKVEKRTLAEKTVFSIDENRLLICLEKNLSQAAIDAIADVNPQQVICLDDGFKDNDQLKVNAVQAFKSRAQQQGCEMVFRTV